MRNFIALFWTWITYRRHRSELAALRLARNWGILGIIPIIYNAMFWWFVGALPIMLLAVPGFLLWDHGDTTFKAIGAVILFPAMIYGLFFTMVASPWFFDWYFVAVGVSFGRTGMADRKEAYLLAATAAYSKQR